MGVFLHLAIVPSSIDPAAWAAAYDDSLCLLRAYEGGLLRIVRHRVAGHEVIAYSEEIESGPDDRHWKVEGDARSLRTGETHEMWRDLAYYGSSGGRQPARDILTNPEGQAWVFDAKTQGEPYHLPLLAVATMLESRFPHGAVTTGDICLGSAREAAAHVQRVLGYRPMLPVVLDEARLRKRLEAALPPHEVDDSVEEWHIFDEEPASSHVMELFTAIMRKPSAFSLKDAALEDLASSRMPGDMTTPERAAFESVVRAAMQQLELDRLHGRGETPARLKEALASLAEDLQLLFTVRMWDELNDAPADVLRLLVGLAGLPGVNLVQHRLRTAIFENAAMRQRATELARDEAWLVRADAQEASLRRDP